jgi:hypothetical protein
MYLFDNLPLDMIRFEIFPYLDWTDRVAVNACLPPSDRIRTPLAKDSGLILVMRIQASRLKKQLNSAESANSSAKKAKYVLKIFRGFEKYKYLIEHHKSFRDTLIQKCKNYSNPENPEYIGTSRYFKKTLMKLVADFLEVCEEKYSYKYQINACKDEIWNPIQNRYVAFEGRLKN